VTRSDRAPADRPLVFVTVGTDHHPFHRLSRWVESWLATRTGQPIRCLVQTGTSEPPKGAEHVSYLPYGQMEAEVSRAAVVVTHGGPGSVMLCRWLGKKPVVVPRRHELGEHVDDHQVVFSRRIAADDEVALAEDEATFRRLLDGALEGAISLELTPTANSVTEPVRRFEALVAALVGRGRDPSGTATNDSPRVLYIGGWGRSGSTLLDRALGQLPGFVSLGEVRELWQRGVRENRPCGCGKPFRDCEFWSRVGDEAYGGWSRLDLDEALSLRYSVDRPWSAPILTLGARWAEFDARVDRYLELLRPLYGAIRTVSGADVIVDSSKLPMHAMLLRRIPVDLRLVHLIRDSRGVAFSWQKHVRNRTTDGDPKYLERYDPVSASMRYVAYNEMTRRLGREVPSVLLRYEDFIAEPKETLLQLAHLAGSRPSNRDLGFVGLGEMRLRPNHTVDGNPMRFSVGAVALKPDEQWRSRMKRFDRTVVTALTYPMLRRYRYRARVTG
jgi:UDP-N-acetylglucosamine transferase subunit ALG13